MKKLLLLIITVLSACIGLSLNVTAGGTEVNEQSYYDMLNSIIDSQTSEKLEKIGLDEINSDAIFSVSFSSIGEYFGEELKDKSENIFAYFFRILCILLIVICVGTFMGLGDTKKLETFGTVAISLMCVDMCGAVIEMLLTTMKTGGNFMLSFIPIYTVILSLGGSVSSAVTYNTLTFSVAQVITLLINNYAADFSGIFLSLSMAFSLNSAINLNRFIASVNKLISTVIGFIASGFAAVLSVRGVLSSTIDSAASKSIKFLIGSLIPIVGSSISDAYSTVLGSINVLRGSIAVAGIIIMLIICIPPILEGTFYCLSLTALSYISEMSGLCEVSSVLKSFQSVLRTTVLLNIFQLFILIVSTAIMISLKGGG